MDEKQIEEFLRGVEEALANEERIQTELLQDIDDGDDFGDHVGLQRHRRARYDGRAEVLQTWRTALVAATSCGARYSGWDGHPATCTRPVGHPGQHLSRRALPAVRGLSSNIAATSDG